LGPFIGIIYLTDSYFSCQIVVFRFFAASGTIKFSNLRCNHKLYIQCNFARRNCIYFVDAFIWNYFQCIQGRL